MTGDFEQVLREMDWAARGEDADPGFDDEQMALIADWRVRLLAAVSAEKSGGEPPHADEAWIGSGATSDAMRTAR